ncbi:polysaccharide biosynthesis tyrosine autokinase [Agrococcus carbonis]|uniref:polysaccharide biosynthesis tyrosine autokinase n=1 Tax=Agrococcus carbonis TaxID=684552 RepID=UPI000B81D3EC|nr:polysaccharide biosynthesis tyrosine autokinase [Agrococcus carbonis]
MELRDFARLLRKYWALLIVATLLGVGAGWLAALLQPPTYTASTRVFVSVRSGETASDLAQGSSYTESRVASYASLANSQRVLDDVIAQLELGTDYWTLAEHVEATIVPDTTVIDITASDGDAVRAVALADATAASLSTTVSEIESRPGLSSPVQLAVVQAARPPEAPTTPRPALYMTLAGLLGLALAAVIAVLRDALDTRIHAERDLRDITTAPLLGAIGLDPKAKQRPLVMRADPHSMRAESFRALRTSLRFVGIDERARTFVVTSPLPGMAKSTTTANLGLALADAGQRVIVVDADLRKPKIAEYLNLEGSVGLTDVLIGSARLPDVVQQWGDTCLSVLPAGQIPPNPSEMLSSKAMSALLDRLRHDYDCVLVDSPPLLPVTDAAVIAEQVDAALMVVSVRRTKKHQLELALRRLSTVDARVGGIVFTMVPLREAEVYGYGSYGAAASPTPPAAASDEPAARGSEPAESADPAEPVGRSAAS